MNYPESKLHIKAWAEEDRPREKLLLKGKSVLSDAELLAIIIGSGIQDMSAVELCRKILATVDHDLHKLGKLAIADLLQFKGIGEAKAVSIVAALELGKRRSASEVQLPEKFVSSQQIFRAIEPVYTDLPHEEFWILLLNRNNRLLSRHRISSGGVAGTIVDPKIIFNTALKELASGIVLSHNHPSGNLQPSREDKDMTQKILQGAKLLDICIIDHIIVANKDYYSFRDNGLL
jgi:DNA repair protein RadC